VLAASHDLGRVQASSEVVAVVDSGKACMFAAVAKKKLAGGRLPTGTRGKIQSRQALLTLQHQHPVGNPVQPWCRNRGVWGSAVDVKLSQLCNEGWAMGCRMDLRHSITMLFWG
jgi:hypothetical protein